MRDRVQGSAAAEMLAVCNALYIAHAHQLVQHGDAVLLQTDCLAAIQAFEDQRQVKNPDEVAAVRYFRTIRKEQSLRVSFKHVKGHTTRPEARFVTNNLCDKRAKEGMRQARATLKGRSE